MKKIINFKASLIELFAVAGLMLLLPSQALAKNSFKFFEDIEIHGFVSSSYSYNLNKPATQTNCGVAPLTGCARIFDQDDNSFKLDVSELVFQKEANEIGDIGFRIDLTFGFSLPEAAQRPRSSATVGTGTPGSLASEDDDFDLQQAYLSWKAPVGTGLTLEFGKFNTHVGNEVFSGYDGWNMNFSRTYVFGWGIPFNHTGLRAWYTLSNELTVMGMVANNWEEDGTSDNNSDKTLGAQIAYNPSDMIGIVLNWAGGNQGSQEKPPASTNSNWRDIYDIVVNLALTNELTLVLNGDYGTEQNADPTTGGFTKWWGYNGTVRYDVNKWFSMNVRGAYFDDSDGYRLSAVGNKMTEVTVTPEFRVDENLTIRFEYRHDSSTMAVFERNNGAGTSTQDTVAMNALIHF